MEGSIFKEAPRFTTPEEEIAFLREQLQHKERALSEIGVESNREKIAEQLVDTYKHVPQEQVLHEELAVPQHQAEAVALQLVPETHDTIMEELLGQLLDKGVKNTLMVVDRMNNPHVADDFHRFLIQYIASVQELPGLKQNNELWQSLHMALFEVALPMDGNEQRSFKELIALMEQFFAGMQSIANDFSNRDHNYFTLEMAISSATDEIIMYVGVPRAKADLFEKQILALFTSARIKEATNDYNIFNDTGAAAGAYAKSTNNEIFPIKTYDMFDNDPLSVLINTFSKLQTEGEGAAIQMVIVPAGDRFITQYGSVLDRMKKGESANDALSEISSTVRYTAYEGKGFLKAAKDVLFGGNSTNEFKDDKPKEPKELDEKKITAVTEKIKSTIVETNIRVMASAANENRAQNIVREIQSAFNQFSNIDGNGITFEQVTGLQLREMLHDFTFRMFNPKEAFRLNIKELATLYHFPVKGDASPQLKSAKANEAPAPMDIGNQGIVLGYNDYRGKRTEIRMSREDRLRHFYVIGQTGTGKTTILKNMIAQDIANGDGCCFIDPHGNDIQTILSYIPEDRIDDVIYFDPGHTAHPMGLNMLEYDPQYPEQKSFVVDEMLGIFNKLFDMKTAGGPMFEQYFRNATMLVIDDPETGSTLLDVARVLADEQYRAVKLARCKNLLVVQFWRDIAGKAGGEAALQNIVPYIVSKFDVFLSNEIMRPIVSQQVSAFNFRKIMDEKKILLVNLAKGRLGELNANLLGLIIVGKIQMAALSRVDMHGQHMNDFYLYIDEFQNVTTDSIASILSEARKYHLSLNVAHQYIAQLTDNIRNAVFGNVGSIATYRVSPEDAEFLEKKFTPTFTAQDIVKLDNFNSYVSMLVNGVPARPFNMVSHFSQAPEGNKEIVEPMKELSYLKYGRERAEIEAEILQRYQRKTSQE